jgi:hypothetical protein
MEKLPIFLRLSVTATGWWFFLGNPVSSTNKTDRHDITEIVLKVALSTITHPHCSLQSHLSS